MSKVPQRQKAALTIVGDPYRGCTDSCIQNTHSVIDKKPAILILNTTVSSRIITLISNLAGADKTKLSLSRKLSTFQRSCANLSPLHVLVKIVSAKGLTDTT